MKPETKAGKSIVEYLEPGFTYQVTVERDAPLVPLKTEGSMTIWLNSKYIEIVKRKVGLGK